MFNFFTIYLHTNISNFNTAYTVLNNQNQSRIFIIIKKLHVTF